MNLSDYQKKIEESLSKLSEITYNAELLGAQHGRVLLELRTFATGGSGVKDITGKNLSKYSKAYAARRKKAGLQIANKDLIFDKNTSSIRDNIDIGLTQWKTALGHVKEDGYKIATYQEDREGMTIFALNDSEKKEVGDVVKAALMESIKKMVQGWRE